VPLAATWLDATGVLWSLPWAVALAIDVAFWIAWSLAVGFWAARRPVASLTGTGPFLRLRRFEAGGGWYERRLHIKRWKDRLPEAGGFFGGHSKRALPPGPSRASQLELFRAETVRAETVHWLAPAPGPLLVLWNPWWLFAAMVAFAVLANVPCLVVQRYNRARIAGVLGRVSADSI
jgi:glycosyl-4,4'-diaponeurosporenoate acyltransferase